MPSSIVLPRSASTAAGGMKSAARTLSSYVIGVYFMGVFFATPYFWWKYAHEHSFVATAFVGPLVSGGKAMIWPYFAIRPLFTDSWTQEEKENLAHQKRSVKAIEQFLAKRPMTPEDDVRQARLLMEAYTEAKLVRDDVLVKIHPDYPRFYREKYIGALARLVAIASADAANPDHLREEDFQLIESANRLLNEWNEWIRAHSKELNNPKDIPD